MRSVCGPPQCAAPGSPAVLPHRLDSRAIASYIPVSELWELRFGDEFDHCPANRVDPAVWTYESGWVRNEELQYYRDENAVCQDGVLSITSRRHSPQPLPNPNNESSLPIMCQKSSAKTVLPDWCDGFLEKINRPLKYTSASLESRPERTGVLAYGQYDARIRIEAEVNSWPAWWTLGITEDGRHAPWPAGGEIDMLEYHRSNMFM